MANNIKIGLLGLGLLANGFLCPQDNFSFSRKENLENKVIKKTLKEDVLEHAPPYKTNAINNIEWKEINQGLYFGEINSPVKSEFGDSKINILKIDPEYYSFSLVSSKENDESNKTAKEWAESRDLLATINAGMYQEDHKTNTGFMKNYGFINNGNLNRNNYNAVVAFNRRSETVPEFQIIDLTCQNWDELKDKYHSYSQGIRMIDCNQANRWAQQNKKWSISAIGKDKEGNALFMFARSPYSVHDFNKILLESSLNIYNAMYLEGGPEASFYLNHNETKIEKFGSYETDFIHDDNNDHFWEIPNIIGVTKKKGF